MKKRARIAATIGAALFSSSVWADGLSEQQALDFAQKAALDLMQEQAASILSSSLSDRLQNWEVEVTGFSNGKPLYSITTVQPLYDNPSEGLASFFQGSFSTTSGRDTLNVGAGQRFLLNGGTIIAGVNLFYDHEFGVEHNRVGAGGEVLTGVGDVRINGYWALSGDRFIGNGTVETALDGYDAELAIPLPYLPTTRLHAKTFRWNAVYGQRDLEGQTYSLRSELPWGFQIEAGTTRYNNGLENQNFVTIGMNLLALQRQQTLSGNHFASPEMYALHDVTNRRFEKVRRENRIIKQVTSRTAGGGAIVIVFEGV